MEYKGWDIFVGDIIEVSLPTLDGYYGKAVVTHKADLGMYPIDIKYLDHYMSHWKDKLWYQTAISPTEIIGIISSNDTVLKQDYSFINL